MSVPAPETGSCVVPTVRYRDVAAAIDWLCRAFALERHRVVAGRDGAVRYAELTFGGGMVMVAPVEDSVLGRLMVQPGDVGGAETQICYLFVDDAQAHYERAKAAGAEIVLDIEEEANGGRGYSCRDPEGHIWNFGSYDPWQGRAFESDPPGARPRRSGRTIAAALVLSLAAGAVVLHEPAREAVGGLTTATLVRVAAAAERLVEDSQGQSETETAILRDQLARERLGRSAADRVVAEMREQLALERRLRATAEQAAAQTREQLAALRGVQERATQTATETRSQLEKESRARVTAESAIEEIRAQLAQAQAATKTAEAAALRARAMALRERRARIIAARAAARREASLSWFPPQAQP
jgi:uncharacterized glyoxalase superfamily protein PhnB